MATPSAARAMWEELARNLPLLRHQLSSTAGREMRAATASTRPRRPVSV
ncbi:MAG: hypothetical protein H0W46_08000 [Acidimicrobiia bacterium]|nr:hypothetical protein [Acidimicrobiia bacterium]